MTPQTYPCNSSFQMKVREVDGTGLVEWLDYIPVQAVSEVAAQAYRAESDGHIPVVVV